MNSLTHSFTHDCLSVYLSLLRWVGLGGVLVLFIFLCSCCVLLVVVFLLGGVGGAAQAGAMTPPSTSSWRLCAWRRPVAYRRPPAWPAAAACSGTHTHTHRETERETERETGRETGRDRERQRETGRDRETTATALLACRVTWCNGCAVLCCAVRC